MRELCTRSALIKLFWNETQMIADACVQAKGTSVAFANQFPVHPCPVQNICTVSSIIVHYCHDRFPYLAMDRNRFYLTNRFN
jgi:hypothetical protein